MTTTASLSNRVIRPTGEDRWDVIVDGETIGFITRGIEPGLNDRGPVTVIRGHYQVPGRDWQDHTIATNDLKHAARMIFNASTRTGL